MNLQVAGGGNEQVKRALLGEVTLCADVPLQ